jgi:hypothetical protein
MDDDPQPHHTAYLPYSSRGSETAQTHHDYSRFGADRNPFTGDSFRCCEGNRDTIDGYIYGGDKMKIVTVFLAIVFLLMLTSCSKEEVEVTPVFDAKAEEKAVIAASEDIDDAFANLDPEALDRLLHEDYSGFATYEEGQFEIMRQPLLRDLSPPATTMKWFGYEVFVSPDLAVIKGKMVSETPGPPEASRAYNYVTSVFRKEDGQWQLIHTHASYMP